jgi:hypothetical protein
MSVLVAAVSLVAAVQSKAIVPQYDYRQPMADGVALVGMDCQRKKRKLELRFFYPDQPPRYHMDLWKTSDLVKFDPVTMFLTDVYEVERQCHLGKDKYRVRFRGVPGASNAQWQCGASSGAHATVWKNGRVVFDDELAVCQEDSYIRKVVFSSGTDMPVITQAH